MTADGEPHDYMGLLILKMITANESTSYDLTQPYIKRSLRYVYPLFMFLHALVGLVGFAGNVTMIIVMGKRRMFNDETFFFLGNLAFSDIIKCAFVLPISLANMLIQNWVFGSFMCFILPMVQFFPIHASMLTYLMIAIDRYRLIVNPFKSRVPAGICVIAVWVGAVCIVLPHAIYIKYIDLGALFGKEFQNVGICFINLERHIEEYLRAMFVTIFALPLAIISFLYVRISAELKSRETAPVVVHYRLDQGSNSKTDTQDTDDAPEDSVTWAGKSVREKGSKNGGLQTKVNTEEQLRDSDDDIDLAKERLAQKYLIAMVTVFAICWCPTNILVLVHSFVHETEDNKGHLDITYITFIWFGFLSTCVNPILFASWRMPSATKDRLKGYFRFSNRRLSSPQVSRVEVTDSCVVSAAPSPREVRVKNKSPDRTLGHELSPCPRTAV